MISDLLKIYNYREMLKNMVKKELRSRYKGSILGFFWTFLNPLLSLAVFSVVFSYVMRMNIPKYSYTVFLFVGLVPWTFFANTVQQSSLVIISNGNLIKKVYFPRLILPLSITITNFINMLFTFIIVFVVLLFSGSGIGIWYIYLPIILLTEFMFALAFVLILSSITVYFRDLEHIMSVVIMAWFYLTPIVYSSEYIPTALFKILKLNPMMPLIEAYRDILMFDKQPEIYSILYSLMFTIMLLIFGYFIFNKLQKRFAEEI